MILVKFYFTKIQIYKKTHMLGVKDKLYNFIQYLTYYDYIQYK